MKTVLSILTAGSLLFTAGCAEPKEIAEEYKAEQAAEEAKEDRIRTLDLDQPIHVEDGNGNLLFEGPVNRTCLTVYQSIWSRGDRNQIVQAEVTLDPIVVE